MDCFRVNGKPFFTLGVRLLNPSSPPLLRTLPERPSGAVVMDRSYLKDSLTHYRH